MREKTRAHSGKVRWTPSRFAFVGFHPCWSGSSGGKVDPNDESILHAALREAKEEVGTDVEKIEIMGRLGPPTRSLSRLRFWSYVGEFRMPRPTVSPGDLGEGHCAEKIGKIVGSCWKFLFPNGVKNLSSGWKSRLQNPNT